MQCSLIFIEKKKKKKKKVKCLPPILNGALRLKKGTHDLALCHIY